MSDQDTPTGRDPGTLEASTTTRIAARGLGSMDLGHLRGFLTACQELPDDAPVTVYTSRDRGVDGWYLDAVVANAEPGVDRRPHSRACTIQEHSHGPRCAGDCPTCFGLGLGRT